jgi:chromosome segregation ATPase
VNKSIEETAEAYAPAFAKLRAEMARLQGSLSTCKDLLDASREWLDGARARLTAERAEMARLVSRLAAANAETARLRATLLRARQTLYTQRLGAFGEAVGVVEAFAFLAAQPAQAKWERAKHAVGCRHEQEFPALDPEDCPSCSGRGCPRDGDCPERGRDREGQGAIIAQTRVRGEL